MCAYVSPEVFQDPKRWSELPAAPRKHPLPCENPEVLSRFELKWWFEASDGKPSLVTYIPADRFDDFKAAEEALAATELVTAGVVKHKDNSNRARALRWDSCLSRATFSCNHGPEDYRAGVPASNVAGAAAATVLGGSSSLTNSQEEQVGAACSTAARSSCSTAAATPAPTGPQKKTRRGCRADGRSIKVGCQYRFVKRVYVQSPSVAAIRMFQPQHVDCSGTVVHGPDGELDNPRLRLQHHLPLRYKFWALEQLQKQRPYAAIIKETRENCLHAVMEMAPFLTKAEAQECLDEEPPREYMVTEQDLYNLKALLTKESYRSDDDDAQSVRALVASYQEEDSGFGRLHAAKSALTAVGCCCCCASAAGPVPTAA